MKTFKQFQEETVTVNELFGLGKPKPKPKPKKSLARKVVGGAAKLAGKAAVGTAKVAGKVVKKVGTAAVKGAAGAVSGAAKGIAAGLREEELKEYSPNVAYQAKGGKKSGKLGKSSVYSLRGKDESKKDFRKSHVKDVEDGYVGKGHKPTPGSLRKEEVVTELNRYGKETGKATGSINKRAGTPIKIGGSTDKALNYVRTKIRKETGKPSGQQKKVKGEKHTVQYGDRKTTPADSIAKRRQSKADAEKLMRDTSGT